MSTKRACDRLSSASREPMAADTYTANTRHRGGTTARGGRHGRVQERGRTRTLRHLLATAAALGSSKPHTIKSLETFAGESCGDGIRRRARQGAAAAHEARLGIEMREFRFGIIG